MTFSFQKYLWDKLSVFIHQHDSYKDQNDKGLLERFLEIYEDETDQQIVPDIEDYLKEVDLRESDLKYLNHFSYTLGFPPDIFDTPEAYRRFLTFVVSIYKIKGTKKSYELLFSILGYDLDLIEHEPIEYEYDSGVFYDSEEIKYDQGKCPGCSDYSLLFRNRDDDCFNLNINPIDESILSKLRQIIFFNEPINAVLRDLINSGKLCEKVLYCYQEHIIYTLYNATSYDENIVLTYDNNEVYDNIDEISSDFHFNSCHGGDPDGINFMIVEDDFIVEKQ